MAVLELDLRTTLGLAVEAVDPSDDGVRVRNGDDKLPRRRHPDV